MVPYFYIYQIVTWNHDEDNTTTKKNGQYNVTQYHVTVCYFNVKDHARTLMRSQGHSEQWALWFVQRLKQAWKDPRPTAQVA